MYSIVKKNQDIVHFLAEKDTDILYIKDACSPGSTVEVLANDTEEGKSKHTFIKSPSGKWSIYEGEAPEDFEIPVNDAKVSVPSPKSMAPSKKESKKVEDFQRGIKIYPSGVVTGTLFNTSSDMYSGDEANGHYLIIDLDTPENAKTYKISIGEAGKNFTEPSKDQNPSDGWLMVRLENVFKTKGHNAVKIQYNEDGPSFTFILDELVLE